MVGSTKPGTRATLTVFRKGTTRDLAVTVAELEQERSARTPSTPKEEKPKGSPAAQSIGLQVSDLTDAQKKESKVRGGVRVDAAADAAARAGIREGDFITQIGNTEINNVRDFEAAVAKADRTKPIAVYVRRGELAAILVIRPNR
jgi:serine protease Do